MYKVCIFEQWCYECLDHWMCALMHVRRLYEYKYKSSSRICNCIDQLQNSALIASIHTFEEQRTKSTDDKENDRNFVMPRTPKQPKARPGSSGDTPQSRQITGPSTPMSKLLQSPRQNVTGRPPPITLLVHIREVKMRTVCQNGLLQPMAQRHHNT